VEVRAREEEKAIRRRATWIAREVCLFWTKAQRVVAFKIRSEVEAKKKEVLDRQLELLLGQTQKYSSFLAQRLGADEKVEAIAAASKAAEPLARSPAAVAPNAVAGVAPPNASPSKPDGIHTSTSLPASEAVSANVLDRDDSMEYRSGEDDDADDEHTLEEEEALAKAEGVDVDIDQKEEAVGLEEDAELPLEELLARYGYVVPKEEDEKAAYQEHIAAAGPSTQPVAFGAPAAKSADKEGSDANSEHIAVLLEDPGLEIVPPSSMLVTEFSELYEDDLRYEASIRVDEDRRTTRGGLASRQQKQQGDEEEYRSGEDDDADDEHTLEEEEALAKAEGVDVVKDQKEEAAGLAEDADLPIEELLARYGYMVPKDEERGESVPEHASTASIRPSAEERGAGPSTENAIVDDAHDAHAINDTMEAMAAAQPTGYTLDTMKVKTPVPFLLKGQLREYQHIGLDWLVTLYHRRLNGTGRQHYIILYIYCDIRSCMSLFFAVDY